MLNFFTFLDC